MTNDEIDALIASRPWYHAFEVVPGHVTPGTLPVNPAERLARLGFPERLDGEHVLDIGALDGPYTFEIERRGGKVTALDIQDPDRTGFNVARKLTGSNVSYCQGSVYDATPENVGTFDIVLYQGVYYHLLHPMLAFRRICDMMRVGGTLYVEGAILDMGHYVDEGVRENRLAFEAVRHLPVCLFARGAYQGEWSNWFVPTLACLCDWIRASGFYVVHAGVLHETDSRGYVVARKLDGFKPVEHELVGDPGGYVAG